VSGTITDNAVLSPGDSTGWRTIVNMRDFGGMPAGERRVVAGRLFRCGHLGEVDEPELERLHRTDIGLVLDLRSGGERRKQPSRRHPEFAGVVIESGADGLGPAPHLAIRGDRLHPDDARAHVINHYRRYATEPWVKETLTRFFAALADTEGSVVVHCTAGKDRTGVAVALLLSLLGVSPDDIVRDYLRSQDACETLCDSEGGRLIRNRYGAALTEETLRIFMGVERAYIEAALAAMAERYGSVQSFLSDALSVSAAQRARIRARFTVAADPRVAR
jgi:protein-tyrosine phosphatase